MNNSEIKLKTKQEVLLMMAAGDIVAECHRQLKDYLKPGLTTKEVDLFVNQIITLNGGESIIYDYDGFPGYNCISVNDCIVHGIPDDYVLQEGDVVGVDISVIKDGYVADSCWSYGIGEINSHDEYLLKHTEKALWKGLNQVRAGAKMGDVSNAIERYAKKHRLGVVRELAGHGVGQNLHEEPMVPNYGKKGKGITLEAGMTIAVEPMLNYGTAKIWLKDDGWSVMTYDGKNAAHFEHTIVVTEEGYELITVLEANQNHDFEI